MNIRSALLTLMMLAVTASLAWAQGDDPPPYRGDHDSDYIRAIERTARMVQDDHAVRLAANHGLDLVNVTWEDTGRFYDSAVGPNISDMTIQVQYRDPESDQYVLNLMPVIRYPNFEDVTADISPDDFYLLVGNEHGKDLRRITLTEYLSDFRSHLSDPGSWAGRQDSLLADRDSHVLVSAQAAFLPVPEDGQATYNPVLFNYQSYEGDPAVLAIVATREGTSATVIDNQRNAFPAGWSWGQRLFFNQNGQRASFTGERLSDFAERTSPGDTVSPSASGESGLNMVLLIQVPLKQRNPRGPLVFSPSESAAGSASESMQVESDVEMAVIGHGEVEGLFTEIDDLAIERDPRFPIRVTVQFYKATSNGVVSPEDMQAIADQIDRVYADADYVGSLVVDGLSDRPTEHDGPKVEPPDWWEDFWQRFEDNMRLSRWEAVEVLKWLDAVARRWPETVR